MVERAYLLIEIISLLIGLFIVHVNKKKPTIITIVYVAVSLIIASMIEEKWLPESFTYLVYFGLVAVSLFEYQDRIYDACIYAVLDILLVGVVQLISAAAFCFIMQIEVVEKKYILIIYICDCIILLLLGKFVKIGKYIEIIFINGILGKAVLTIAAVVCLYIFGVLKEEKVYEWKDVVGIPLLLILLSAIMFQWQKERYLNKQKEVELLTYQKYNSIYKDLISEVRRKQHDFNNHLNAVFAMNLTADSLEQLVEKQNEYCTRMNIENSKNKLLNENISSVLAGFLYTKIGCAEKKDIQVNCKIQVDNVEEYIHFIDLVEILGNLFDNATEAVDKNINRIIDFCIKQDEKQVYIQIANPCDTNVIEHLENIFEEGKSSKGKGRGIGLSNVVRVVDKYHGKIEANNIIKEGVNYIVFDIILKK